MEKGLAERFAKEWVAAWNSHDLDRILAHYDDDFEMSSPIITTFVGEPSGRLKGKKQWARIGPRRCNPYRTFDSSCSPPWPAWTA
jgi:ketosteroid isomerase-like protein